MNAPIAQSRLSLAQTLALTKPVAGPREFLPDATVVLIVGAGPTGLTALHLMGAYGIPCVLVDKAYETSKQPKAIAIDDEYQRLLTRLGVGSKILRNASEPFGIHFIASDNKPVIRVRAFQTPNGFGNRVAISQPLLEKTLLTQRPHGNIIRYGTTLKILQSSSSGSTVILHDNNGECYTIHARFVLGCDGAKSTVRTALGINFPGRRIDEPHLVVDFADFPDSTPASRFHCFPARPFNSIPAPFGGRRLEFMLNPDDDKDWVISDAGIRWLIDTCTPYQGSELHIIRRAIYGFSERIAERLQQDNIFLLGDAAHVMPPFGGQGVNTAARDADNLAWKLAAVHKNLASPSLLRSYDPERRTQITQIARYSVRIGQLTNIRSARLSRLRDAIFRSINLVPSARAYLAQMRYMPKPRIPPEIQTNLLKIPRVLKERLGTVFPKIHWTTEDGVTQSCDDESAFNHLLILFGGTRYDLEAAQMATRNHPAQPTVVQLQQGTANHSTLAKNTTDPLAADFFNPSAPIAVLVRPDRYIAGIARTTDCEILMKAYLGKWH